MKQRNISRLTVAKLGKIDKMLIGNIINDSFGLLSKQLKFYCWHYKRNLDQRQRQELIDILNSSHFERLANRIKSLLQSNIADCKQQITKLLFERCLLTNRRHQLVQLIESNLVDLDVRLDNYGRTLLHRTVYNLDVELVKLLIEHGVNIRLRDYAGNTALHIVIQSYRNGALIHNNNELDVAENLKTIIKLLLDADKRLQDARQHDLMNETQRYKGQTCYAAIQKKDSIDTRDDSNMEEDVASLFNNAKGTLLSQKRDSTRTLCGFLGAKCKIHNSPNYCHPAANNDIEQTISNQSETSDGSTIRPLLMEDASSSLVDTKNAFGRTALHYCVLVVGEQHLDHVVELLISFGADPDAIDVRMKTPLYCLVKRPGVSAIRQKCQAITHLLNSGCDDLGLAINPSQYFTEELIATLNKNLPTLMQSKPDCQVDLFLDRTTFRRVPSLKHLSRLFLIKRDTVRRNRKMQSIISLPDRIPKSLKHYVNRRILDQSELF